jgi:hypothetical protein
MSKSSASHLRNCCSQTIIFGAQDLPHRMMLKCPKLYNIDVENTDKEEKDE